MGILVVADNQADQTKQNKVLIIKLPFELQPTLGKDLCAKPNQNDYMLQ